MLRTMRRKVPWIVVFEVAMMMRSRWKQLPPDDRHRLADLARRSHGNPMNLTRQERADFRRIASGLDVFGMAREFAPMGRRMRHRR
jgi:hypothetical protein